MGNWQARGQQRKVEFPGVVVECVDTGRNTSGEGGFLGCT